MRKLTLVCMALFLLAGAAFAGGSYQGYEMTDARYQSVWTSEGMNAAKQDTIYLLGGPENGTGKFQDDFNPSLPDDEGWYGVDITQKTESKWHIDTFNAAALDPSTPDNHALWAGETFANDCSGDYIGYDNNYQEYLDFYGTVANPLLDTVVTVNFSVSYDTEENYDWLDLQYSTQAGMVYAASYTGTSTAIDESVVFNVSADDYVSNQIHLRFNANSDGYWSDGDCDFNSLWGLAQIDNIEVLFDGVAVGPVTDFESGLGLGTWELAYPVSVGNFAQVWPLLDDLDPCLDNITPQFAFIDDGVIEECTGGTTGGLWSYGPDAFNTNYSGGCAGAGSALFNEIWSPPIAWPTGDYVGARAGWDIYRHMPYSSTLGSDGTFYVWHVRSSLDGGMTWSGWGDRGFIYYGGPDYISTVQVVTDLIEPGATHVQMAIGVQQILDYQLGDNSTPAPYLDNMKFLVYSFSGPSMTFRDLELAQDNFPTIGTLDLVNLGNNDIRFDMANDLLGTSSPSIVHGDSITLNVNPVRPGSALVGNPMMHYRMKANPVFDDYRTITPVDGYIEGDVEADSVFNSNGNLQEGKWAFDLDDEDFFYPGDVIHYYIYATDRVNGDPGTDATTYLPAGATDPDSGFGVFPGEPGYISFNWPSTFIVRGLPTFLDETGTTPPILFWNDFGNRGGENEWIGALNALGYLEGTDYDIYYTQAPSSGVGNGLGPNATANMLSGYDTMLYTAGDLASFTITGPAYNYSVYVNQGDKGNDLLVVDSFLQLGKNFFATGDNLVSDLLGEYTGAGGTFVSNWFKIDYEDNDVRPLLGNEPAPAAVPVDLASNFDPLTDEWLQFTTPFIAYGSCPRFHEFDAISPDDSGRSFSAAEFEGSSFSAVLMTDLYNDVDGSPQIGTKVVLSPVDFDAWYTPYDAAKALAPLPARANALAEILFYFDNTMVPSGEANTGTPDAGVFSARNFPNPFNPTTKIEWTIPRAGDLSIKVFNVRGELVKTLVQGVVTETAGSEIWNGKDNSGKDVASGVYFYEVRSGSHVKVSKMALVK